MPMPTSSPTGASCSDAEVDQDAAGRDVDAVGRERSPPPRATPGRRPCRSRRVGDVAHVDRREACRRARSCRPRRTGWRRRGLRPRASGPSPEPPRCGPSALDRSTRPFSTVQDERRVRPAKAGCARRKRSSACWDSVPGSSKVVGGLTTCAGGETEQKTTTAMAARALRFQGAQIARQAREELRHLLLRGGTGSRGGAADYSRSGRLRSPGAAPASTGAATITVAPMAYAATPMGIERVPAKEREARTEEGREQVVEPLRRPRSDAPGEVGHLRGRGHEA